MSDIAKATLLIAEYYSSMRAEALMANRSDQQQLLIEVSNALKALDDVLRVAALAAVGNDEARRFLSTARASMETTIDALYAADRAAGGTT